VLLLSGFYERSVKTPSEKVQHVRVIIRQSSNSYLSMQGLPHEVSEASLMILCTVPFCHDETT